MKKEKKYIWSDSTSLYQALKYPALITICVSIIFFIIIRLLQSGYAIKNDVNTNNRNFVNEISDRITSTVLVNFSTAKNNLYSCRDSIYVAYPDLNKNDIELFLKRKNYLYGSSALIYFCKNGNHILSDNIDNIVEDLEPLVDFESEQLFFLPGGGCAFSIPYYNSGECTGSLIAYYDRRATYFLLTNESSSANSISFVIDRDMNIVAGSEEFLSAKSLEMNLYTSYNPPYVIEQILEDIKNLRSNVICLNIKASSVTLIYEPLDIENGLMLFTVVPIPFLNESIESYFFVLLGLCIVTLLLLILSFFFLTRFVQNRYDTIVEVAYHDSLTGGLNTEGFLYQAKKLLLYNDAYIIVSLSFKEFAAMEERFGLIEADSILKSSLYMFESRIQQDEIICRTYMDNYLLLLHDCDRELLENRINFFATSISSYYNSNLSESNKINIEFYCGVYKISDVSLSIRTVAEYARIAHESSKQIANSSRSIITYYDLTLIEKMNREKKLAEAFVGALDKREFVVFYQPKVDARTDNVVGTEALIRWFRGDKIIPPFQFIPLFEKNGYILDLDLYVFEEVCADLSKAIKRGGVVVPTSINLSRLHFQKPGIVSRLNEIRKRYNVAPNLIELEITETVFLEARSIPIVRDEIKLMHEIGFACSLDDFGVGYSSLSLLMEFDIDYIKLDKSFIDKIDDPKTKKIVCSVIDLASALNIDIIAEGVESEDQREIIQHCGCNLIQGYLYSKPLPLLEYEAYLKQHVLELLPRIRKSKS